MEDMKVLSNLVQMNHWYDAKGISSTRDTAEAVIMTAGLFIKDLSYLEFSTMTTYARAIYIAEFIMKPIFTKTTMELITFLDTELFDMHYGIDLVDWFEYDNRNEIVGVNEWFKKDSANIIISLKDYREAFKEQESFFMQGEDNTCYYNAMLCSCVCVCLTKLIDKVKDMI